MEIRKFGFYWLDTWVLANVIQLATQNFCMRHLNKTNDPFPNATARGILRNSKILPIHLISSNVVATQQS